MASGDRKSLISGGDDVIHGCHGALRPPDLQIAIPNALEGLRRCDFVDEMQVDVKNRRAIRLVRNYVVVPDFLKQRLSRHDDPILSWDVRSFPSFLTAGNDAFLELLK